MNRNSISQHSAVISEELNIMRKHVSATLRLLDEGATVPFISRYRKEATGSLDEVAVRNIQLRHEALTALDKRKDTILASLKEQKVLTPELQQRIEETTDSVSLEDIYLPFKPKRATRAATARQLGLEPLARIIMSLGCNDPETSARRFVKGEVNDADAALAGACDIIAEWVSESEKARSIVRSRFGRNAVISSKVVKGKEEEGANYRNYFDLTEPLRSCNSHRYLAMRRGEAEGILKVSITIDDDEMVERLQRMFVKPGLSAACADLVKGAVRDGYKRLLRPSIENETATLYKDKSDDAAIGMFADNVRQLLMEPPLKVRRVMGVDPGYRTGCKIACIDAAGNLLAHDVMYPVAPRNDYYGAADLVCSMVDRFNIDAIAVGNGTAGRETRKFLQSLNYPRKVDIYLVNEDGASVYSASDCAREEFPDLDLTVRGAVSIGRRLLDPLAELVKIDPKSIGVGQYQHDVNQPRLRESLDYVVSSCVNRVGVNLNTASQQLLSYVSGVGPKLASNIVDYRVANGDFATRADLMNVPRMGEKAFRQCAGFLRIPDGDEPLDNTAVHPERYDLLRQIAADLKVTTSQLIANPSLLASIDLERYVSKDVGLPTLNDIVEELRKPGRDPREKNREVAFDESVNSIADLHIGRELNGKVTNVTSFGVFVDIGLKENGLVHISQLSDRYISSPFEVVEVGRFVRVRVIDVDIERSRISLTMKGVPQD